MVWSKTIYLYCLGDTSALINAKQETNKKFCSQRCGEVSKFLALVFLNELWKDGLVHFVAHDSGV